MLSALVFKLSNAESACVSLHWKISRDILFPWYYQFAFCKYPCSA